MWCDHLLKLPTFLLLEKSIFMVFILGKLSCSYSSSYHVPSIHLASSYCIAKKDKCTFKQIHFHSSELPYQNKILWYVLKYFLLFIFICVLLRSNLSVENVNKLTKDYLFGYLFNFLSIFNSIINFAVTIQR